MIYKVPKSQKESGCIEMYVQQLHLLLIWVTSFTDALNLKGVSKYFYPV